jgi:AcrR family transcriptional regulator
VPTRAGVSKSVFYEFFCSVEECYRAVYEEGLHRLSDAIAEASGREQTWVGRVRSGLVALLGFFDDEPAWARVLVLDTPASTHACRQRLHELLARLLDQHGTRLVDQDRARLLDRDGARPVDQGGARLVDQNGDGDVAGEGAPVPLPALTAELVVGGVYSVIRASTLAGDGSKLVELAPSLMAFIAVHYGLPVVASETREQSGVSARADEVSRAAELPIRATRRTTLVLRAIALTPYSNNREVAQAAGIADEGQTSKLLARLERQGVVENVGVGAARGEPNAWLLTASGRRAVDVLGQSFPKDASQPSTQAGGVA